jgi:hypothetical protein
VQRQNHGGHCSEYETSIEPVGIGAVYTYKVVDEALMWRVETVETVETG